MRLLSIAVICAALVFGASTTFAKRAEHFTHSFDQVWNAAIRLIRIDEGFPIKDRDEGIGFFLFEYENGNQKAPGSVELIRSKQDGAETVMVVMKVPKMPSYVEQMLLDKLGKKLTTDYGVPPKREKKPPPPAEDEPDETPPPSE